MKQEKVRKHIFFYGRVQGVGFRYYAVQKANQLIIFLQNRTYIWIERIDAKKISLQQDRSFCEIY